MRRISRLPSALLCAALLAACATPEQRALKVDTAHTNVVLTEASAKAIDLRRDQTLVIRLTTDSTTGFQWILAEGSPALLEQQGQRMFEREALTDNFTEAAGRDVFRFRPMGTGVATLAFEYRRPRDREGPQQSVRFTVSVK